MDYYLILGMVVVAMIALYQFISQIRKEEKEKEKENINMQNILSDLKICIAKLNSQLDSMAKNDIVRDKRIEKHGEEIDKLDKRVSDIEKKQYACELIGKEE